MEMMENTPRVVTICFWHRNGTNYLYWDDAEDHGGFDRISPMGPFASERDLKRDVVKSFPRTEITYLNEVPEHYYVDSDKADQAHWYGDDGDVPEPIKPVSGEIAVNIFGSHDYVTVLTVTRQESGGPVQFNAIYLTVAEAKEAIEADLDELDCMYNYDDYSIDEKPVFQNGNLVYGTLTLSPVQHAEAA